MKDLSSPELKRFESDNPAMQAGFNVISPNSSVHTFDFPIEDGDTVLHTIVSVHKYSSKGKFCKVSMSVMSPSVLRAVSPSEVYMAKDKFLNHGEDLAWYYDPSREKRRARIFRATMNTSFDMNNFVMHFSQYDGGSQPFTEVYTRYLQKVQKNRGFMYCRGNFEGCKFILVKTDNPFPWMELQTISRKEFGMTPSIVIFNEETKKYPEHYVI